jgi:hypothetical protein
MDVFLVSRTTVRGGGGGRDPQATASGNAIRIVAMRRIELGVHCATDGCASRALVSRGASQSYRARARVQLRQSATNSSAGR